MKKLSKIRHIGIKEHIYLSSSWIRPLLACFHPLQEFDNLSVTSWTSYSVEDWICFIFLQDWVKLPCRIAFGVALPLMRCLTGFRDSSTRFPPFKDCFPSDSEGSFHCMLIRLYEVMTQFKDWPTFQAFKWDPNHFCRWSGGFKIGTKS